LYARRQRHSTLTGSVAIGTIRRRDELQTLSWIELARRRRRGGSLQGAPGDEHGGADGKVTLRLEAGRVEY